MLSMSNQKCLMEPIGVDVTGTTPGLDGAETDTSKQHFMVVAELESRELLHIWWKLLARICWKCKWRARGRAMPLLQSRAPVGWMW